MLKNIIFDFGDVFINLDKPATEHHLKKFGITTLPTSIIEINKLYEQGKVSTNDFITEYLNTFPQLTIDDFIKGWNSILKDLPDHRLQFLKELKKAKQYQIFLLSNTNELHIDWVKENYKDYDSFKSCFHDFYLSYEMGLRKPNAAIFSHVLNENKLKAEDTLFIDDTEEHILSARSLGIATWHLNPKLDDVTELFDKIIRS
jgi:putative hydrolase of the HAD superfamily